MVNGRFSRGRACTHVHRMVVDPDAFAECRERRRQAIGLLQEIIGSRLVIDGFDDGLRRESLDAARLRDLASLF